MCHETDSKPKWINNPKSMVTIQKDNGLSKKFMAFTAWVLSSRFWSVMLRLNLIMMDANWRYYALTQGIRTIKTFIKYKKCAAANRFTAKFKKQCQILQLFRQKRNIISQTNHKYLASTTHISHTLKFLLQSSNWRES